LGHSEITIDSDGFSVSKPFFHRIPPLSDFGYPSESLYSNRAWIGGETEALRHLDLYCSTRKNPREINVKTMYCTRHYTVLV